MWFSKIKNKNSFLGLLIITMSLVFNGNTQSLFSPHAHQPTTFSFEQHQTDHKSDSGHLLAAETDIDIDFETEIEEEEFHYKPEHHTFYVEHSLNEILLSKYISNLFNRVSIPLFVLHHSWRSDLV
jgi:hypothetical protein